MPRLRPGWLPIFLRRKSGTLRGWEYTPRAPEWDQITGAREIEMAWWQSQRELVKRLNERTHFSRGGVGGMRKINHDSEAVQLQYK